MAELEPAWELKAEDNVWAVGISRDGNLVVIGSWDSSAYGVDRKGSRLWQHKTSDYVKGVGLSSDGELVVVGSYDRYIYAIKGTGKLAWRYKTENYVRAATVSADGEYVAAGSWRGTLYYLDKRGKLLWKHRIGSAILDLAVSGDGGMVVAGCDDGTVHAFDLAGAQKWSYKCAGAVTDVAVSGKGERVLVCAKDTVMACLTARGDPQWRFHIGGISKGLCLVQGDEIAVVFTDNNFLQYVDSKGELMFMRRLPEEIWEGVVAEDGISVAVATKDNRAMMFEIEELAPVVLEATQQAIERVVAENIDVAKAQELHQRAGDLLSEGKAGEAIRSALEAAAKSQQIRGTYISDQAGDLIEEVEQQVADHPELDMRKAIRFLAKARRSLQEDVAGARLDRALFYARLSKEAVEASIEARSPAVEDELFQASQGATVEVDESDVNRLLGLPVEPKPAPKAEVPGEAASADAAAAARAADGTVSKEAALAEAVAGEIEEETMEVAEPPAPAAAEAERGPEEPAVAEPAPAEEEALLEESEVSETAAPYLEAGQTCPKCGTVAGTINDRCKRCYSDEIMRLAIQQAKRANKDGLDISALAPDLKAIKSASQSRVYDEIIAISERILLQLEDIMGEGGGEEGGAAAGGGEAGQKLRKKKKRKKLR